ncbi:hypothetical protein GCM10025878_07370 [Leuconostoc gasicomitatum]|uniref:hypothetical protein n=1 Tax=Leuconostoc TaxID=1243 RepID=UPI0005A28873|nr:MULTISPECIES: hypothetical protein [Leuconostoc]MCM6834232.1 hypothetical protein [Leuconostoc mesenteroides]GMA05666.1 hypothetical protein GCM10025878_07370 [Leuconostoc gasicomitatum]
MKKGIKKAITSPTKETVITDHKRPIHGFCYTHFNMDKNKKHTFTLSVEEINRINLKAGETLLVIDSETSTVKPANEEHFHEWLKNLHWGGEQ